MVRVIVAGELPRLPHNAPLHLFSASPELVGFGGNAYQRRSKDTSELLRQLFVRFRGEGFAMSYTMDDFRRQVVKDNFAMLTPEEQREALESLPAEQLQEVLKALPVENLLAALPAEQIQRIQQQTGDRPAEPRKPRRKK